MEQTERAKELFLKGLEHLEKSEFKKAEKLLVRSLTLAPTSPSILNNLAIAQLEQKKFHDAAISASRLLRFDPRNIDACFMLATCEKELKNYAKAVEIYDTIVAIDPSLAKAHCNRGHVLNLMERYHEAITSLDRAIAIEPLFAEAHFNRGNSLRELDRYEDALASYDRVLTIKPDDIEALFFRANMLLDLRRIDDALAGYDRLLTKMPDNAGALLNRGIAALLAGDFATGWASYDRRLVPENVKQPKPVEPPVWDGESIEGKSIFVYDEQGMGDIIQFARYLSRLSDAGAVVTFRVRPQLHRLLQPFAKTVRLVDKKPSGGTFDFQIALMSLPTAFRTTIDTIPATIPYLVSEDELVDKWRARIGADGLRIGISWQGNPEGRVDKVRSIPLRHFHLLAALPGVRLISLQKTHGLDQLANLPEGMRVETLGAEFDSGPDAFVDTAAVMASLDLIVTSDTSLVHLAGALGRPVWVGLKWLPDWRWMLDRSDSPWYPTMKLYRQPERGDWDSVFRQIASDLPKFRG